LLLSLQLAPVNAETRRQCNAYNSAIAIFMRQSLAITELTNRGKVRDYFYMSSS